MDIPIGFQFDPQSGLYYKEEDSWADGAPVRLVTWLDSQSGATQQVCYPAAVESPVIPEAAPVSVFSIPEGFAPYPGSDLYFQTENCMENGVPVQRVTYYNPAEDSYHQVDYPVEQPSSEPGSVTGDALSSPALEEQADTAPDWAGSEQEAAPATAPSAVSPAAEEELLPEPVPVTAEEPLDIELMEMPLDEEEELLDPPPEPLLAVTGLPEQNPYVQQHTDSSEPPPIYADLSESIEQEIYTAPGVWPLPEKKNKLAVIAAVVGALMLIAVGVCGWRFGWFGGQSAAGDGAEASQPPVISVPSTTSGTSNPAESPEVSSEDGSNPLAQLPVSVTVEHYSPWDANITLSGIPFKESYSASIPGKDKDAMLYRWSAAFGSYEVALLYFCKDANDTGTVTPGDMQCNLWKIDSEGGGSAVGEVTYEIAGDSITFFHVTLPAEETDAFDFSSPEATYAVTILEGDARLEKDCTAFISKAASEETPVLQLEQVYRYTDEATALEVVLEIHQNDGAFRLAMDLGGSTYSIWGSYFAQSDDILILEANAPPPPPIWPGNVQFLLQTDGGLQLEGPGDLGVLPIGGVLMPTGDTITTSYQAAGGTDFPYAGEYVCGDEQIPTEYRPSIRLDDTMGFTMTINTDQGMVEGAGQFAWDIQTGMIYLNFEHISGGDPGDGYREADVKILGDDQLQFLTEGFGLMGYDENLGIFTRY